MIDAEHLKGLWLPRRKTNNHLISLNEKSNIQFLELLGTKQTLNVIIPSLAHIYCAFFHRQLVYQKKIVYQIQSQKTTTKTKRHLIFESTKRILSVLQIHECKYVTAMLGSQHSEHRSSSISGSQAWSVCVCVISD